MVRIRLSVFSGIADLISHAAKCHFGIAVIVLSILSLPQGCATIDERKPLPQTFSDSAVIPGMPDIRFFGDSVPPYAEEWFKLSQEQLRMLHPAVYGRRHYYLAISGGGANGAFGAGLLTGWTAAGSRPEFTLVTGISTGALIAPFAFLGPDYDHILKEIYTTFSTDDLIEERNLLTILTSDAAAGTQRLKELIARYVSDDVMQAIAAENRQGRALYIGTTNLDAARPVIWDISAIAASGAPGALDLIHQIMLASASIPGAFPPVYIDVEAGGQRYDEMHVDGGTASQVFLYPLEIDWERVLKKLRAKNRPQLFLIRNSFLNPGWETIDPRLVPILSRSVSSLIRTQGIGDMYRMYLGALRDELDFNLAYIPDGFDQKPSEIFDPVYMSALYDYGYNLAKNGYPWEKAPPGYEEGDL